jgi:hypothetical protein
VKCTTARGGRAFPAESQSEESDDLSNNEWFSGL